MLGDEYSIEVENILEVPKEENGITIINVTVKGIQDDVEIEYSY
jgi:hypothetical protein